MAAIKSHHEADKEKLQKIKSLLVCVFSAHVHTHRTCTILTMFAYRLAKTVK